MELHDEVALTAYNLIFLGSQDTSLLGLRHYARWIISAKQDSGMFYFERVATIIPKFVSWLKQHKVWTRMRWCMAPTIMLEFFNSSPLHAEANQPSKYRVNTVWTRPNIWTRQQSEYLPNQQYLLRNAQRTFANAWWHRQINGVWSPKHQPKGCRMTSNNSSRELVAHCLIVVKFLDCRGKYLSTWTEISLITNRYLKQCLDFVHAHVFPMFQVDYRVAWLLLLRFP